MKTCSMFYGILLLQYTMSTITRTLDETTATFQLFANRSLRISYLSMKTVKEKWHCAAYCLQWVDCKSFAVSPSGAEKNCYLYDKDHADNVLESFVENRRLDFYDTAPTYPNCISSMQNNNNVTGKYVIKPSSKVPAIIVICDITSGKYRTIIQINNKKYRHFHAAKNCPGNSDTITYAYSNSLESIVEAVDQSSNCEQWARLLCVQASKTKHLDPLCQFLKDRNGNQIFWWAGGSERGFCICGTTNRCSESRNQCNCMSAYQARNESDQGVISQKHLLPLTGVVIGGTSGSTKKIVAIGDLLCYA